MTLLIPDRHPPPTLAALLALAGLSGCEPAFHGARARHAAEYGCSANAVQAEQVAPSVVKVTGCGVRAFYVCRMDGVGNDHCVRNSEGVAAVIPTQPKKKMVPPKAIEAGAVTYEVPVDLSPGDKAGVYEDSKQRVVVRHEAAKFAGTASEWIASNYPDATAAERTIDDTPIVFFQRAKKKTRVVGTAIAAGGEVHVLWCAFEEDDVPSKERCKTIVASLRPTP